MRRAAQRPVVKTSGQPAPRGPAPAPEPPPGPLLALLVLVLLHAGVTLLSALIAAAAGSRFVVWFDDTGLLLAVLAASLLLLGIAWDGSLALLGVGAAIVHRLARRPGNAPLHNDWQHQRRFFRHGPWPILMMLVTALAILGTSNLTLLNLELLGRVTQWRDPWLWRIEAPILERLPLMAPRTDRWDRLYHSAWAIEVVAAFALTVIGRNTRLVLAYCVSMILLFYIGRLLGVLNPVMGPAFFRPDVFHYLDGSVSGAAMRQVARLISGPPALAHASGGILLGGVSAMPSLHVAMVATTACWLALASRWTLLVTVPWILLVWSATVVLGWHYLLDGAGGIALGLGCSALAAATIPALLRGAAVLPRITSSKGRV